MQRSEKRREKLRRQLRKEGIPSLLVSNEANVTYLTGFTGDSSYLLLDQEDEILLTDGRYTTQLESECPGLELAVRQPGTTIEQLVQKVIRRRRLSAVGIEADSVSLATYTSLRDGLAGVELVSTRGLVEGLREIKDAEEIAEIRRAIRLAEKAMAVVRASLRREQTEREVAHAIESQIRMFGGQGCSFAPIVGAGPNAALPHYQPGQTRIGEADFVLIDWGARDRLYVSDLTRILVTGRISPKLQRIYGVVLNAQRAAIKSIRPGVLMQEVDRAARKVIERAGYGRQFSHGLGHGIGLEIHEAPRLAANDKRPLRAGMVITIEPGIYLPGWGGVRIEDDVLVDRAGHEVLSGITKKLAECVVD